tara:strand:- start:272 stop:1573 length:1302 start_codon:yes stop_codon:yes gene_type:complete
VSKTRNLSDLLDANGDVKSGALDNVPASDNASALTTGTLPNARLSSVPNSALANSSITINGSATALGGSATITTDLVNDTSPQLGGDLASNGNDILMADNDKIKVGTGNDLEIFHDGSNSIIKDAGTGQLQLHADNFKIMNAAGSENIFFGAEDGTARLFHDNVTRFETTSSGATVTGTLTADGVSLGDNENINIGASNDLQLFHNASDSFVQDAGTGVLKLRGNSKVEINQYSDDEKMAVFNIDGAAELYHNGVKKFETTSGGVDVTGALTVNGSALTSGLTNADQFRLTSTFTGDASPISSNLFRVSETGSAGGEVGSQMSVSSGIFTFPQTGMYLVTFGITANNAVDSGSLTGKIKVTTNNSSYSTIAECRTSGGTGSQDSAYTEILLDVSDTSNVKVKFDIEQSNNSNKTKGDSNSNLTYMTFLRLGDT